MAAELVAPVEVFAAARERAFVRSLVPVSASVFGEVGRLGEGLVAHLTTQWFLPRVAADVHGQGTRLAEGLGAVGAFAGLVTRVDELVLLKRLLAREGLVASVAGEGFVWFTALVASGNRLRESGRLTVGVRLDVTFEFAPLGKPLGVATVAPEPAA